MAVNCVWIVVAYVVSGGRSGSCGVVVVGHSCGVVRCVGYNI